MARGEVRRGVVALSLVVAGAAGCSAGGGPPEQVARAAPLVRLGLNPDGTMQVPGDYQVAGWFTGVPQPGQLGRAVIAGHVDSRAQRSYRENLVLSATRAADGGTEAGR